MDLREDCRSGRRPSPESRITAHFKWSRRWEGYQKQAEKDQPEKQEADLSYSVTVERYTKKKKEIATDFWGGEDGSDGEGLPHGARLEPSS